MQCASIDPTRTGHRQRNCTTEHRKPHQFRPNHARINTIPTGSAHTAPKSNRIATPHSRRPYTLHAYTGPGKRREVSEEGGKAKSGTSAQQLRAPRSTTFSRPEGLLTSSANGDGSCGGGDGEAAAPAGAGAAISPLAQATTVGG
jgi:hypothetical protein